ncbi:unnamed protein product [Staurois parvus]|uniref:Uncharacterized protein n=1 Tax=Staurois parvus TaxID=386267 RepID=A0ABN9D8T7_9NEOB|nr:unnamed protein product [Staurois parvus]
MPLSGLLTHCWCVQFFDIGCWQITGLPYCCCQAPNLPWAPIPPPHAAAKSRVSHGSLYGLPLLLSPSPHSAMCHFQVSSHCWWCSIIVIGVLYASPLLLASTATPVAPHSFGMAP